MDLPSFHKEGRSEGPGWFGLIPDERVRSTWEGQVSAQGRVGGRKLQTNIRSGASFFDVSIDKRKPLLRRPKV